MALPSLLLNTARIKESRAALIQARRTGPNLRLPGQDRRAAKIRTFIDGWNDRCHPFVWTKTAEQVLKKANRKKTSNAGH